jgi:hypothetical protein
MQEQEGFQIPQEFIHRLNEYTQGYLLFVCNEAGEISSYESFDTPIIKLGLYNFAQIHANAYHNHMDQKAFKLEEKCDADDYDADDSSD